jgi:arginine utilization protein RocB
MKNGDWYTQVKDYTERLVGLRGVSPGIDEIAVAKEILTMLRADGLEQIYTECALDALENDPYGRQNVYAFLRGASPETVVLLGHFDTVDTYDYGALEALALDPSALLERKDAFLPASEAEADFSDWMFGRGAADMKSGIAVHIALMRHLAQISQAEPYPLSILLLATCDEENESAGILHAIPMLLRLRERYGLNYIGALNTDYVTSRYPGDERRYIYAGSIGKLLPSFLCIGRESHAGDPFRGLDANLLSAELIRDLSMNDALCDAIPGQIAAPPVTLHATDLKSHYDVQLPIMSYFYLNVLTLTTTPRELLTHLSQRTENVVTQLLQRIDETEQRWHQASGELDWPERLQQRTGIVYRYADLYAEMVQKFGLERVSGELVAEHARWSNAVDRRELCMHLTQRLWQLSGHQGPAVIIFYAPPYYPALSPVVGPLQNAIDAVVAAHPEIQLEQRPFFPYLSDMSYLGLDLDLDLAALEANLPIWQSDNVSLSAGAYHLPLTEMQSLNIPAINWGPFGRGAHQRDEAVLMSYSFGILPQLLLETLEQLATSSTRN